MSNAQAMYELNLDQAVAAIAANGHKRTTLVQGHMGCGKSSMLAVLAERFPTHHACYFDCTTKDLGDITIPHIAHLKAGADYVEYLTNEELGLHLDKPVILMIDEYGKANPAVKNALLRLMLERKMGGRSLHRDSIVFSTTNLGVEGVGDLLPAHARNRLTVIALRKPTHIEWIEWGIENGIDLALLGWVKDNPQVFADFREVKDPDDNPYIFHPRSARTAFVTPRSLEGASDWLKVRDTLDRQTLTAALMGTLGDRAAMDLAAFITLADQLPKLESIKASPDSAPVPTSPSAVCMVVFKVLQVIEQEWVEAWLTYMNRLPKEAQGMFVNGIRAPKYNAERRNAVMTSRGFGAWARQNAYLFSADGV